MSTPWTVLWEQTEHGRFERDKVDDGRTAIDHAAGLAADLRRSIDGEVRFDTGARVLYAIDGGNDRQAPIGVVIPRNGQNVEATVRPARR